MKDLNPVAAGVLRAAGGLLSPGGRRGSLAVLIFHRVLPEPDPLMPGEPDQKVFAAQMRLLRGLFNVLPLSEAVDRLASRSLPARALSITFDDGYRDNLENAAPILRRLGLPATFFISTAFIEGGRMWNDTLIESIRIAPETLQLDDLGLGSHRCNSWTSRRDVIHALIDRTKYLHPDERLRLVGEIAARVRLKPSDSMMTEQQLRELCGLGMELGAHTVNHPILTSVTADVAREEIAFSRRRLVDITAQPISLFAYPNGRPVRDYAAEHVRMVRQLGFRAAVSTGWGYARSYTDIMQIPRMAPWDRTSLRYAARILKSAVDRDAPSVAVDGKASTVPG